MTWNVKYYQYKIMVATSLTALRTKKIGESVVGKRTYKVKDGYLALHRYNVKAEPKHE